VPITTSTSSKSPSTCYAYTFLFTNHIYNTDKVVDLNKMTKKIRL